MRTKRQEVIAFFIFLYSCTVLAYGAYSLIFFSNNHGSHISSAEVKTKEPSNWNVRKLQYVPSFPIQNSTENPDKNVNCTPPDIEQFPRPLIDYATRRKGGLTVHIFVSLYLFLCLAVICDEYFVPSLEKMCKLLNMQSDVAGATFMAAGSSAPELATAIIAVFIAKDDIGIGTVVGSAVYNIAFVIGICGLFAGRVIYLNWWPLFRDCFFYLISILALLFALRDENVTWVESVLLLILYIVYILFMFLNRRVEEWFKSFGCTSSCTSINHASEITYHPLPDMAHPFFESGSCNKLISSTSNEVLPTMDSSLPITEEEEEEESSIFSPPAGACRKFLWILSLPLLLFCYITIPDCRKSKWEKWFFLTFLSSCIWIGVLSYILVWMITIIGYTLHIKDTIMGLTFLAAGASIPDAISSLLVARDGYGDMAISNAVGSNVFDILLCLGLPWFLKTAVVEPGSSIPVRSKGLTYSTLTLLLTVVFLLLATHLNRWKLDKKYGAVLLAWYALFMVVATIYESFLFGSDNLPACHSDF